MAQKSILLVDDSRVARMMLRKMLPEGDYEVRQASSGAESLELYRERVPDLVFLDLTMPDMDGFETLAGLKEIDADANVVVVTADIQESASTRVMKLGAIGVVSKPPDPEHLIAYMKEYVL